MKLRRCCGQALVHQLAAGHLDSARTTALAQDLIGRHRMQAAVGCFWQAGCFGHHYCGSRNKPLPV
jgi:hypothetical protein